MKNLFISHGKPFAATGIVCVATKNGGADDGQLYAMKTSDIQETSNTWKTDVNDERKVIAIQAYSKRII